MPNHDFNLAGILAENIKVKAEQLQETFITADRTGWSQTMRKHVAALRADVRANLAQLNLMIPED